MAVRGPIGHSGSNFCNRARNGAWRGRVDSGQLCAPGSDRTKSTMFERLSRARETQALGHGARGRAHAGAPHACRRDVRCRPSAKARSGGTRTPDTRIMVPLRFGSTAGFEEPGGHNRGMSATGVACPETMPATLSAGCRYVLCIHIVQHQRELGAGVAAAGDALVEPLRRQLRDEVRSRPLRDILAGERGTLIGAVRRSLDDVETRRLDGVRRVAYSRPSRIWKSARPAWWPQRTSATSSGWWSPSGAMLPPTAVCPTWTPRSRRSSWSIRA